MNMQFILNGEWNSLLDAVCGIVRMQSLECTPAPVQSRIRIFPIRIAFDVSVKENDGKCPRQREKEPRHS